MIGVAIMYDTKTMENCVPREYISELTPYMVIADMKLDISENATGHMLWFLSPNMYSCVQRNKNGIFDR